MLQFGITSVSYRYRDTLHYIRGGIIPSSRLPPLGNAGIHTHTSLAQHSLGHNGNPNNQLENQTGKLFSLPKALKIALLAIGGTLLVVGFPIAGERFSNRLMGLLHTTSA